MAVFLLPDGLGERHSAGGVMVWSALPYWSAGWAGMPSRCPTGGCRVRTSGKVGVGVAADGLC